MLECDIRGSSKRNISYTDIVGKMRQYSHH
jgi:hypothetical protein